MGKKEEALKRVQEEIEKIDKNENKVMFFVIDTKGNPNGSLEYIYNLALIAKESGYNVSMLHQEEEFVGVRDWLGDEYADLEHYNISKDAVEVSPSDILFIPELFSNVMNQTKKLPCKRIAILQNFDYIVEQMPLSVQWGDFGIMEAITNTKQNARMLGEIFPYVKTKIITPFISDMFCRNTGPKDMVVNIVAKKPEDVNMIVKPFYWKYPSFKWVSFKDLRGMPKQQFAKALREGAITIWVDDSSSFGYSALEAMKSGSIVIAKIPNTPIEWMEPEEDEKAGTLRNCCVWFDDTRKSHRQIASVIRSWITDNVPDIIFNEADVVAGSYTRETTKKEFEAYLKGVISNRKNELEALLKMKDKNEETEQ